MKLCFFNLFHIGDILFTMPFIQYICETNKNITFYYFFYYGDSLLTNINNLKRISQITNKYNSTVINNNYENYIEKDNELINKLYNTEQNFIFNYNNDDYIGFNCWCNSLGSLDCDIKSLNNIFFKKIIDIINKYGISICIPIINNINLLPKLPYITNSKFKKWYDELKIHNNDVKLIYIYNYQPRSVIFLANMNLLVKYFADKYKDNKQLLFIVSKYHNIFNNTNNIISCDILFDAIERPDCYNLLINEYISNYCNIIITVPCGGSWLFFNNTLPEQTSKKYMLTLNNSNSIYVEKLNNSYKYATNNTNNIINNISILEIDILINNL
jgi:hypothetical protein